MKKKSLIPRYVQKQANTSTRKNTCFLVKTESSFFQEEPGTFSPALDIHLQQTLWNNLSIVLLRQSE